MLWADLLNHQGSQDFKTSTFEHCQGARSDTADQSFHGFACATLTLTVVVLAT